MIKRNALISKLTYKMKATSMGSKSATKDFTIEVTAYSGTDCSGETITSNINEKSIV